MLIVSLSAPRTTPASPVQCVIEQVDTGTQSAELLVAAFASAAREARGTGKMAAILTVEDLDAVIRLQRFDAARDRFPKSAASYTRDMVDLALSVGKVVG